MKDLQELYCGATALFPRKGEISGDLVRRDGESFYCIRGFDRMPPFFLTLVSHSNHWMFVSSYGALSCGRKDAGNALFPYYTDDKIHDAGSHTGPKSLFLVRAMGTWQLWEPFQFHLPDLYRVKRNIYKNRSGNMLVFEEENPSLGLRFSYTWMFSASHGFVRHARLENLDEEKEVELRLLDGVQNILPAGVDLGMQTGMSTLVDAYKLCELHEDTGLGIYTLSSIPSDRAEPNEALEASTLWSAGLEKARYLLSTDQIDDFRQGKALRTEKLSRGQRGAYFLCADIQIEPASQREWLMVAEVGQGPSAVTALVQQLKTSEDLKADILADVARGTKSLDELVGLADGLQKSDDPLSVGRHYSNTLFNIMRGGIFSDGYQVNPDDFKKFIGEWNRELAHSQKALLDSFKHPMSIQELQARIREEGNPDLYRLSLEYLPLSFSRRHGDPSRPWNRFSIDLENDDGSRKFSYQGNWRDIFQNWEALSLSFPEYIESFIARFLNASTPDGYNPYRISREGVEWEILDLSDPWSNIGYWGDHQVIYLCRLLELSQAYHPGRLQEMMEKKVFVYVSLPYKIHSYEDLVLDPRNSITYDEDLAEKIRARVELKGSDGKLVHTEKGEILRASLAEKLLVSFLAKLSNFVPGGGIWMNTQRPEWNDANNALVGNGLSMVTLYYLRRFSGVLVNMFSLPGQNFSLPDELAQLMHIHYDILIKEESSLQSGISDQLRRQLMDALGKAGSEYREGIYSRGFSGQRVNIEAGKILDLLHLVIRYLDHSIELNRRSDGLFHSYNLLELGGGSCKILELDEMLEGQVAVLSSGFLNSNEQLQLLDSLFKSRMYRSDQDSFTLYPDRILPGFLEKNILPGELVEASPFLLQDLQGGKHRVLEKDIRGGIHFVPALRNATELKRRLVTCSPEERDYILEIYESCFRHRAFTGRSGRFFKYEGLGSIYWHMVSKLLLAVQDLYFDARNHNLPTSAMLMEYYNRIKQGLGLKKSPERYGAFPTDPYSHTPAFIGVQQPGMTGQVKEDLLTRFGELGVHVEEGCLRFDPELIHPDEYKVSGVVEFSLCSVHVEYHFGQESSLTIEFTDGRQPVQITGSGLDLEHSQMIFRREGTIARIRAELAGLKV